MRLNLNAIVNKLASIFTVKTLAVCIKQSGEVCGTQIECGTQQSDLWHLEI